MNSEPCRICLNFNGSALSRRGFKECQIFYYALRASAETCHYCKIILDGIVAWGFDQDHGVRVFNSTNYPTFSLTRNSLLASWSVEPTLEYYLTDSGNQNIKYPESISDGEVSRNFPATFAVKARPVITPFWEHSLKTLLSQWLREPSNTALLPKRVLDLGKAMEDQRSELQLFESHEISAPYVALSHCWVDRDVLTTTMDTLAARISSIPFELLSQTFQEAVMVCRWLGLQYLWIDSLCIIQDNTSDWEDQASKMDVIYENAFFTLAAHGIRSSILPNRTEYQVNTSVPEVEGVVRVRMVPVHEFLSPEVVVLSGEGNLPPRSVSGRGWCYQERLLSSQILHFTDFEVLHEDPKGRIRCQCGNGHVILPETRRPVLHDSKDPARLWRIIFKQYSPRAFTRHWDVLPGLAGIARRFQQHYKPGTYLAGLWEVDLGRWLCWRSVRTPLWGALNSGCGRCGVWPRRLREPPPQEDYIVPSFSWTSRIGSCEFLEDVWGENANQVAQIRKIQCKSVPQNPFGRFTECAIHIQGLVLGMKVISTVGKDRKYVQRCRTEYAYLVLPDILDNLDPLAPEDEWYESAKSKALSYDFDATDDIPADGRRIKVLEMFKSGRYSVSLVLDALKIEEDSGKQAHRRIGICNIPSYHFLFTSQEEIILI